MNEDNYMDANKVPISYIKDYKFELPPDILFIIKTLEDANYEAYVVGGAVRDLLLGLTPKDYDFATNATPQQVKKLFKHTIDTGIKHGTVTINLNNVNYEITTYREDEDYEDHRHPKHIKYSTDIRDDLKRRDFTINAIAYNPSKGCVDPFDGIKDIENHVLRCVGYPYKRFQEDALRILRLVRFTMTLPTYNEFGDDSHLHEWNVDSATLNCANNYRYLLRSISKERITDELRKMFTNVDRHIDMRNIFAYYKNIFATIIPQIYELENKRVFYYDIMKTNSCLETSLVILNFIINYKDILNIEHMFELCMSSFFSLLNNLYSSETPNSVILKEIISNSSCYLRLSKKESQCIYDICDYYNRYFSCDGDLLVAINSVKENICDVLTFAFVRDSAKSGNKYTQEDINDYYKELEAVKQVLVATRGTSTPYCIKQLDINGNDIITELQGISKKGVGNMLDDLLKAVMYKSVNNNRKDLIKYAKELYSQTFFEYKYK